MSSSGSVVLAGIGWDHERCMAPLHASLVAYRTAAPHTHITWASRSLREFGDGNLKDLARNYDLLIFDHPYVGEACTDGWLVDWTQVLTVDELAVLEADSLGPCFDSYRSGGGLWGLPIDAAAQVSAFRPSVFDRVASDVPRTGSEVLRLARDLRSYGLWMALPSVPIDAVCTFLTLCANLGEPVSRTPSGFPSSAVVRQVLELQAELLSLSHRASLTWNPIQCYEYMRTHDDVAYVPFAFGYTNYSRAASSVRLEYANIPAFGKHGPQGAILGGAGIGISTRCRDIHAAVQYGQFLASAHFQSTEYTRSGGQPASLTAWRSASCNAHTGGFLSGTLETMTRSYLRPTFAGYVPYFKAAGERIRDFLAGEQTLLSTVRWLRSQFLMLGQH